MSTLLDDLLGPPALREDAGSRERWKRWEELHGRLANTVHALSPGERFQHANVSVTRRHDNRLDLSVGSPDEVTHALAHDPGQRQGSLDEAKSAAHKFLMGSSRSTAHSDNIGGRKEVKDYKAADPAHADRIHRTISAYQLGKGGKTHGHPAHLPAMSAPGKKSTTPNPKAHHDYVDYSKTGPKKHTLSKTGTLPHEKGKVTTLEVPDPDHPKVRLSYQGKSNLGHSVRLEHGTTEHVFHYNEKRGGWFLHGSSDYGNYSGKAAGAKAPPALAAKLDKYLKSRLKEDQEADFAADLLELTEAGFWVGEDGAPGEWVEESAETARLSVTHAPRGKGGTNWITKSKPGNTGQLPAYIQNVRNAIARGGKTLSQATAIAIGRVRAWARGGGNVGPEVKAAAAKAIAEYDRMRGKVGRSSVPARKVAEAYVEDEVAKWDKLDWGAFLEHVRAAPGWRETPPTPKPVVRPWDVLGPPDDPNGPAEVAEAAGLTIRGPRRMTQNSKGAMVIPGVTKTSSSSSSSRSSSSSSSPTTSRERWAKWDKLNSGKVGAPVQGVQARLGIKADGNFGPKTQAAVRRFQTNNGLQVDGIVGRQTYAALAGRKNAKTVKTGLLSHHQVGQLAALSRHGGTLLKPRRRKLKEEVTEVEAFLQEGERATHADFPERVKGLRQGEVARMPDGVAVKRAATEDGRDVFQVGEPSTYSDRPGEVRYFNGRHHRTAEDAIHGARETSAARTDPESVGGSTRLSPYTRLHHQGREVIYRGLTRDGKAIVHEPVVGNRAQPAHRLVAIDQLAPPTPILEAVAEVAGPFVPFS